MMIRKATVFYYSPTTPVIRRWSLLNVVVLLLAAVTVVHAQQSCPFQKGCECRGATWAPGTTLTVQRGTSISTNVARSTCVGGCNPRVCISLLSSCNNIPCNGPFRATRFIDGWGYIHQFDDYTGNHGPVSYFYTDDSERENCLDGYVGVTANGQRIFSTVIIRTGHTVDFERGVMDTAWRDDTQQQPTPSQVSCGGHDAPTCSQCPITPDGNYVGEVWCNGQCIWSSNENQCIGKTKEITYDNTGLVQRVTCVN